MILPDADDKEFDEPNIDNDAPRSCARRRFEQLGRCVRVFASWKRARGRSCARSAAPSGFLLLVWACGCRNSSLGTRSGAAPSSAEARRARMLTAYSVLLSLLSADCVLKPRVLIQSLPPDRGLDLVTEKLVCQSKPNTSWNGLYPPRWKKRFWYPTTQCNI